MKKWHSILFLLIFVANSLSITAMSVWYASDTDYFVDNFCVNKEITEKQCHGKCHLSKQFSDQESGDKKKISVPVLELEFTQLYAIEIIKCLYITKISHQSFFLEKFYQKPFISINIPPPSLS